MHQLLCNEFKLIYKENEIQMINFKKINLQKIKSNIDACKIWREDRPRFNEMVRETVKESLGL